MPRNVNVHREMIENLAVKIAERTDLGISIPVAGDTFRWLGRSAYSDEDSIQREAVLTVEDLAEAGAFDFGNGWRK